MSYFHINFGLEFNTLLTYIKISTFLKHLTTLRDQLYVLDKRACRQIMLGGKGVGEVSQTKLASTAVFSLFCQVLQSTPCCIGWCILGAQRVLLQTFIVYGFVQWSKESFTAIPTLPCVGLSLAYYCSGMTVQCGTILCINQEHLSKREIIIKTLKLIRHSMIWEELAEWASVSPPDK